MVAERETTYQYLRVLENEHGRRRLELNEGQATHSIYDPDTVLTGGYWDGYLVLPQAVMDEAPASVAMLGDAAGTVPRAFGRYHPTPASTASSSTATSRRSAASSSTSKATTNLTTHTADARPFLRATDERYDAIFVDAYRQPYIPFYLATREFFDLVHERLNPGGAMVINVGHPEGQDNLEEVLSAGSAPPSTTCAAGRSRTRTPC